MNVSTFGFLPDQRKVLLYKVKAGELELWLSTLGASIISLKVPSRKGIDDIVLGYKDFEGYLKNRYYFGSTVGRFANRISGASFNLNGKTFHLDENKPGYTLHGGSNGFARKLWDAEYYETEKGKFVRFTLWSPDGDQGFPGNLKASVTYGLTFDNTLVAKFEAEVSEKCPVSLTNHTYFNLSGAENGKNILSNLLILNSSEYVEVDDMLIPTGRTLSVENTPFDFRRAKTIGKDIESVTPTVLKGYDHAMVLNGWRNGLRYFGEIYDEYSGRRMIMNTTYPAVQFYTANMLTNAEGRNGSIYGPYSGVCFETEYYPDSPNISTFPSAYFSPSRKYMEQTCFSFSW